MIFFVDFYGNGLDLFKNFFLFSDYQSISMDYYSAKFALLSNFKYYQITIGNDFLFKNIIVPNRAF